MLLLNNNEILSLISRQYHHCHTQYTQNWVISFFEKDEKLRVLKQQRTKSEYNPIWSE